MARSGESVRARAGVVLLAVLLLLPLGACSLVKDKLPGPKKPEPTAWQKVMAMTGPSGEVGKEMALAAFATAYGPLPGVAPMSGDRDGMYSGSAALRWISARWLEITAEQRAAVGRAIGRDRLPGRPEPGEPSEPGEPGAPQSTAPVGGAGKSAPYGGAGKSARYGPPAANETDVGCPAAKPHDNALEQELIRLWSRIGPNVGLPVAPRFGACVSGRPSTMDDKTSDHGGPKTVAADTWGLLRGGAAECQITTYPSMIGMSGTLREEVLVHELGHCVQDVISLNAGGDGTLPSWLSEGWSNWLAGKVTGRFSQPRRWSEYLTRTQPRALTGQSYEALGFWWEAEYRGIDVWQAMRRAVLDAAAASDTQRNDIAFLAALGGQRAEFLEGWASSFLREGIRNAGWETAGVGVTDDAYLPANAHRIGNDKQTYPARSEAYDPGLTQLDLAADVVKLESGSDVPVFGRFGPGVTGDYPLSANMGVPFCTLGPTACVCPPDTPRYGTKFQVIDPGPAFLASTGGERGTVVNVTGQSIEEFCGPAKKPVPPAGPTAPGPKCQGCGAGSTNGDPHMTTFDGVFYDLMSVGEFTLVDAADDTMLVQTRQVPLEGFTDVSVNSAVAADVAGDRVGFYLKPDPAGVEVRLDGKVVGAAAGDTALPKGGTLTRTGEGPAAAYTLTWPDGSQLFATPIGSYGLKVDMAAATARKGQLTGLLGNFDGDRGNDLDAGDGRVFRPNASHADIHGVFADHWRVTQADSLFDYEPGQSTATFTDRGFPKGPVTVPPQDRARAEQTCRAAGVTDPQLLDACVLDVALTGRAEFAASVAAQQKFREAAAGSAGGGLPVPAECVRGNGADKNSFLFDIKVGATVRVGALAGQPCAGYLPAGQWTHELSFKGRTGQVVELRRDGDADCRLRWSLWKSYIDQSGTTSLVRPAVSVCEDLGKVTLPADETYIILIDKTDPAAAGRYGFGLTG